MARYHMSPDGVMRVCSAQPGNCKYGEASMHLNAESVEELQEITDKINERVTIGNIPKVEEEAVGNIPREDRKAILIAANQLLKNIEEEKERLEAEKKEIDTREFSKASIRDWVLKKEEDNILIEKKRLEEDIAISQKRYKYEKSKEELKQNAPTFTIKVDNYEVDIRTNEFSGGKPKYEAYTLREDGTRGDRIVLPKMPQVSVQKIFKSKENKEAFNAIRDLKKTDIENMKKEDLDWKENPISEYDQKKLDELNEKLEENSAKIKKNDEEFSVTEKRKRIWELEDAIKESSKRSLEIRRNIEDLKEYESNYTAFEEAMGEPPKDITKSPERGQISIDENGKINNAYVKVQGEFYPISSMEKTCAVYEKDGKEERAYNAWFNNWNMSPNMPGTRFYDEGQYVTQDIYITEKNGPDYEGILVNKDVYADVDTSD